LPRGKTLTLHEKVLLPSPQIKAPVLLFPLEWLVAGDMKIWRPSFSTTLPLQKDRIQLCLENSSPSVVPPRGTLPA
jgi:hypothetical protein